MALLERKMSIIVYDLDGTLRDVTCADHLIPEDKTKAVNWTEWQLCVNLTGSVIREVVDTYVYDCLAGTPEVIILTNSQSGTREWLHARGLPQPDEIIERREGDNRHPVQYKKDWLIINAHGVVKWVDDSQEVCDYVRATYPHIEVVQVGVPSKPTSKKDDKTDSPLDVQVGGDHYKELKIQPAEYCAKNDIGFLEGNVIKYVTRHKSKNGIEDINKAIHCLELIKNLKYGEQK